MYYSKYRGIQIREIIQEQPFAILTILLPQFESRNLVSRDFCLEMDDINSSEILEVYVPKCLKRKHNLSYLKGSVFTFESTPLNTSLKSGYWPSQHHQYQLVKHLFSY